MNFTNVKHCNTKKYTAFTWTFTWTWEVQLQLPWILQVNSFRILPRSAYRAQKENPVIHFRFRGFTKQCCNLISYGVVFLWGNDLETQVSNKLTSRFILSNNSIQIYEISDKKSKYDFYYSICRFMADISVTVCPVLKKVYSDW